MKILSIALLVSVASVSAALAGEKQAAPFVVQEQGKGFTRLAEAVQAIGDGDGTFIIAPGTYRQCVVQTSGRVAFKAQQPGTRSEEHTSELQSLMRIPYAVFRLKSRQSNTRD